MKEMHFPWLECSIFLPIIGAIACIFAFDKRVAHRIAVFTSAITFLCSIAEWYDFSLLNTFEAHDHWDAVKWLFRQDLFVVDVLSAPLLPLSSLLFFMTFVSTLNTKRERFSFGLVLVSEAIVMATLSCHSPWLIVVLLSLACVPPWIELRQRGASTRIFSLHMGLFVTLTVVALCLSDQATGLGSTSFLPTALLTLAALLRAGVFPLHLWIVDLFEHATFGSALLFVAPMTGAYAVMHLVLPVAPDWAMQSIAVLSLTTAVYAAGMAATQTDMRRFFCYLFLSHASLVLSGLEIVTMIGLTGALCVWLSVGMSLGGFGLTMRAIEARTGRISLDRFHGMYELSPTLAGLFIVTGLASIGFPGTVGFVGMELLVEGAVGVFPFTGLAVVLASTLNGIAIMRAYFFIFTGRNYQVAPVLRSSRMERLAVLVLTGLMLCGGLWPQPFVLSRQHAAESLMRIRAQSRRAFETTMAPADLIFSGATTTSSIDIAGDKSQVSDIQLVPAR